MFQGIRGTFSKFFSRGTQQNTMGKAIKHARSSIEEMVHTRVLRAATQSGDSWGAMATSLNKGADRIESSKVALMSNPLAANYAIRGAAAGGILGGAQGIMSEDVSVVGGAVRGAIVGTGVGYGASVARSFSKNRADSIIVSSLRNNAKDFDDLARANDPPLTLERKNPKRPKKSPTLAEPLTLERKNPKRPKTVAGSVNQPATTLPTTTRVTPPTTTRVSLPTTTRVTPPKTTRVGFPKAQRPRPPFRVPPPPPPVRSQMLANNATTPPKPLSLERKNPKRPKTVSGSVSQPTRPIPGEWLTPAPGVSNVSEQTIPSYKAKKGLGDPSKKKKRSTPR